MYYHVLYTGMHCEGCKGAAQMFGVECPGMFRCRTAQGLAFCIKFPLTWPKMNKVKQCALDTFPLTQQLPIEYHLLAVMIFFACFSAFLLFLASFAFSLLSCIACFTFLSKHDSAQGDRGDAPKPQNPPESWKHRISGKKIKLRSTVRVAPHRGFCTVNRAAAYCKRGQYERNRRWSYKGLWKTTFAFGKVSWTEKLLCAAQDACLLLPEERGGPKIVISELRDLLYLRVVWIKSPSNCFTFNHTTLLLVSFSSVFLGFSFGLLSFAGQGSQTCEDSWPKIS